MDSVTADVAKSSTKKKTSFSRSAPHGADAGVYAALDLGTNNCRLLIASPHYQPGEVLPSLKVLDSYSRIVRLGEGLGAAGMLSTDAMERTLAALKACHNKLQKYPNAKTRFVTTEAARRATNTPAFLQEVRRETGMQIEVITNEEEALLAFYGCSSLLKPSTTKALTFDIGGGSTEFMWAHRASATHLPEVTGWSTIPYGVMNLSEQFGGPAYAEMYFEEIVERIASRLRAFDEAHGIRTALESEAETVQVLSTSGTVTTLAAIHFSLPRYDRSKIDGVELTFDDLRGAVRSLLEMTPSQRHHHPCIGSQRADYIISGCAILEAIHRVWPFLRLTIADRGVREGIIMGQLLGKEDSKESKES